MDFWYFVIIHVKEILMYKGVFFVLRLSCTCVNSTVNKKCFVITDNSCSSKQDSQVTKALHQTKSLSSSSVTRTIPGIS